MAMLKCPDCLRDVSDAAPACPGCGRPLAAAVLTRTKPGEISGGQAVGVLLLLAGLAGLVYFFLFFDVSVPVGGGHVNNIGLMADRQNGVIVAAVAALVGVVLAVALKKKG